jgi:hypothetical protein
VVLGIPVSIYFIISVIRDEVHDSPRLNLTIGLLVLHIKRLLLTSQLNVWSQDIFRMFNLLTYKPVIEYLPIFSYHPTLQRPILTAELCKNGEATR